MNDRSELRALTSVRGIAAWFVVLFHIRLSIAGLSPFWLGVLAKGYLAVDFFFMLSGFVIWLTYANRLRDGGFSEIPRFLRRRIARIWPLHLFMLGCATLLAMLFAASGRADPVTFPFAELPLHLLLIQNWGFTHQLSWNHPAWSISAEMGAYLLFPLMVSGIDWRRIPSAVIFAAMLALFLLLYSVMAGAAATTLASDIPRFGLFRCVVEFSAGTMVAALWDRGHHRPLRPAILAAFVLIATLLSWQTLGLPEICAVPAMFAALLLLLSLTSGIAGNPLDSRALHYLGEISYATYLGHFLLFVAFKLVFVSDPTNVSLPLIAIYLACVLASSAILYHGVERPAQRLINQWHWPKRQPV